MPEAIEQPPPRSMEVENNNLEELVPNLSEKVMPIIEVKLDTTPPSATSTPINLNTKPEPPMEDLKVVNKNFINSGGNRYWTNQALQNDNSTKISQVDLVIYTEALLFFLV